MRKISSQSAFSLVEIMVAVALFTIIGTAGFIVFNEGQKMSSVILARVDLKNNLRQFSQRFSMELQESAPAQMTILNNAGVNNTDIIRFAVPVCPCGVLPIDENSEIRYWGAPSVWGQSGCNAPYPLLPNGRVEICHLPPGNPNNPQNLQVNVNAVKAHLAHGDWLGPCNVCNPAAYVNRWIEYSLNAEGRIQRRVLDTNGHTLSSAIMAQQVTDLQFTATGQNSVIVNIQLEKAAAQQRMISVSDSWRVLLRNED